MSPLTVLEEIGGNGFPRVSGDEPSASDAWLTMPEFSPRERG